MTLEEARYVLAEFDDEVCRFRANIMPTVARKLRSRLSNALTVAVMDEEELERQGDKQAREASGSGDHPIDKG